MSCPNGYDEYFFDTASEFLLALSPWSDLWKGEGNIWIFRGHGDAGTHYRLVPSAGRAQSWQSNEIVSRDDIAAGELPETEFRVIHDYLVTLDRTGSSVRGDSSVFRRDLLTRERQDPHEWPEPEFHDLCAIAQHYGIPTRLLDWTRLPKVAAFFAAEKVAQRKEEERPGAIAVWALATANDNEWISEPAPSWGFEDLRLEIVRPPLASCPRLAAQRGLFTLVRSNRRETGRCCQRSPYIPLEQLLVGRKTEGAPFLRKLVVPAGEADEIVHLLARDGVDAASIYLGHEGAARHVLY